MRKTPYTTEEKKKMAEKSRIRYHTNKEYKEKKLLKMKEWAILNKDKISQYDKNRRQSPERLKYHAEAQAKYRKKMRELGLEKNVRGNRTAQNRRWQEKNKHKRQSHLEVYYAIKKGLIKRLPCEKCGNIKSMAHHDDYTKPLDVRFLCAKHHYQHHKEKDWESNSPF